MAGPAPKLQGALLQNTDTRSFFHKRAVRATRVSSSASVNLSYEEAGFVREPWPRLTRQTAPAAPNKKTALTAEEVAIVEADAAACIERMRWLHGDGGATIVSSPISCRRPAACTPRRGGAPPTPPSYVA